MNKMRRVDSANEDLHLTAEQEATLSASIKTLPQYLFRTASDVTELRGDQIVKGSRGVNNITIIAPDALQCHSSLSSMAFRIAREMIIAHLAYRYSQPSQFTSWTSSLLFAIVHCIRKSSFLNETGLKIYMLDTRKLSHASIYPATTLLKVYDIKNAPGYDADPWSYIHEYLAHGPLVNDCHCYDVASFSNLLIHHLWSVFDGIYSDGKELVFRIRDLRNKYFAQSISPSSSYILDMKGLGQCFADPAFHLPATLAFLAGRLHQRNPAILRTIDSMLRDLRLPLTYLEIDYVNGDTEAEDDGLPEFEQFRSLMRELCDLRFEEDDAVILSD